MGTDQRGLRQVILSQAQLDSGLVKDPNLPAPPPDPIPVPWETIAVIGTNLDELARRWHLVPQVTVDGLDALDMAVVDLPVGLRIALKRHHGHQLTGTQIDFSPEDLIDEDVVWQNPFAAVDKIQEEALAKILDALCLTYEDLVWERPLPHPFSATFQRRPDERRRN